MGLAIHQPWIKGESLPLLAFCFSLSTQLFNSFCIHTYSRYSHSSYLSWMSLQAQLLGYPLFNKCAFFGCFSWLSFISVIFQSNFGASWLPSCTKILLMVRMRPTAIVLNYSVKNIQNNVRQKIIFDETSRFNWLVWGSLMLAPTREWVVLTTVKAHFTI